MAKTQSGQARQTKTDDPEPEAGTVKTGTARRSKREKVLKTAAELIARHGFDGTSMRDIAAAVDMLPGSLYYHFPSKEDMLIDIHERVVNSMITRVEAALEGATDPWDRLERAAIAHLEGVLESGSLVTIVSPNFPKDREALNARLKAHRNEYETLFQGLFASVPVRPGADRRLMRLQLLGSLNWVTVWYNPGGNIRPADIARGFVRSIRDGCAAE